MGLMDNIERGLERVVNGAFARTFRSGVQPVEISAALKRELDVRAVTVDRDRVLAPNVFTIDLAPADAQRLQQMGGELDAELRQVIHKHAENSGYQLLGPAVIQFNTNESTATGTFELRSEKPSAAVSWSATLELEGQRHALPIGSTIIGRGSVANIKISDSAASRQHLEIVWDGKAALARDLGSTNGSKIDGQRFREARLHPDSVIYIGQTPLRFAFTPSSGSAASASPAPNRAAGQAPAFWEGA